MSLERDIRLTFLRDQPVAAARVLEGLSYPELAAALAGIEGQDLVPVMDNLTTGHAVSLFRALSSGQKTAVLGEASPRLALLLLGGHDSGEREQLLGSVPVETRDDLRRLGDYGEHMAGRLMDRVSETVRTGMSVAEGLEQVRQAGRKRARSVYVVDGENRLAGKIDMQALALAGPDEKIDDLLGDLEGRVMATDNREEIVRQLDLYRVDSIPVVDVENRLMGIVRYHRLFEALESVATAGLQRMVGASADERALSPPGFSIRRRLPWLHINLLTAFLAAAVVGLFETLIGQFTALAVLLPVVAGQSGNAGAQALAVTMRGLALREIGTREWGRVLNKEVRVGLVNGLALAVTCGLGVFAWSRSFGLSVVIAVAMVLSMVAAGIAGALVPVILVRMGQDPATASSIILTTVTDVAGFFAFLGTATLLSFML